MGEKALMADGAKAAAAIKTSGQMATAILAAIRMFRENLEHTLGRAGSHAMITDCAERSAEGLMHAETEAGHLEPGERSLDRMLELVGGQGFGHVGAVEHDWSEGWLLVESPDAAEARLQLERGGPSSEPCCDVLRGWLAGTYGYARRRSGLEVRDLVAVETSCAGQGARSCRIAVGSRRALEAHGIETPAEPLRSRADLEEELRVALDSEAERGAFAVSDVDGMPFGVVTLDLDGRVTFANRKALDMVALPSGKLAGTHFSEHFHADDTEVVLEGFKNVVEGQADPYPVECRVLSAAGVARQCSVDAFPITNARGEVTGYQAIVVDLSEQGRTGNREQRLHLALRESPWPYMELEPEGRIRHANRAAGEMLGRNPDKLASVPFTQILSGTQSSTAYQSFLEVSSGHKPYASGRWEVDGGEEGERILECHFFQDGRKVGRVERVLVLLQDVSEREEVRARLHSMSVRYDALTKIGTGLVFETDADGVLRRVCGPVEKMLGCSPQDLVGLSFPPYVHAEDVDKATEVMRRAAGRVGDEPEPGRTECRLRRRDGTWGTFAFIVSPVIEAHGKEDGAPSAIVGMMRDTTKTAQRLKQLAEYELLCGGLMASKSAWVVVTDPRGSVRKLSHAFETNTGFEAAGRLGKPLLSLLAPGGEEVMESLMEAGASGGTISRVRLPFRRAEGGDPCVVELEPTALRDKEGNFQGLFAVGRDVTEEAEHEAAEVQHHELARELAELRSEVQGRYGLNSIIGRDAKMRAIYETILAVSRTQATVLIQGETGTGKELVAKAIHYNSPRKDGPFVKVDCGALAENLLESELFGHVKGAFTGAVRDRPGRFELALGGTIFLDEVHNLSIPLQAKLLRVVQDGAFEKVGGTKTQNVDVRMIAATNEDLEALVARGAFRKDLYYRLNVIPVLLPALRDRRGDIPLLVSSFTERFAERHGRDVTGISKEALDRLVEYDWPGNVRELENIVEQAVVFCRGRTIRAPDIRLPEPPAGLTGGLLGGAVPGGRKVLREALADPERRILLEALARTGGNKKRAAQLLGISRSALYEKLNKHGLSKKR